MAKFPINTPLARSMTPWVYIFIANCLPDKNVKALGIRMDVDCCIWDTEEMDKKTPMNHIATFDGVGYIHGFSELF